MIDRCRLLALILTLTCGLAPVLTSAAEDPVQVTTGGGSTPAVSPDGQWLLYRSSSLGVCRVPIVGGDVEALGVWGFEPDWSPSGDAVLHRTGALEIYEFDGGASWVLHDGSGWDDGAAWSPLGDEIAVQGEPVMLITYPGGELSTVACEDPDGSMCAGETPSWSPDGQWIAFEDGLEILKVRRGGGLAEVVVEGLNDVGEPAWSPNGEWIAFVMIDQYPRYHIWVSNARGTDYGLAQVTFGETADYSPAWTPDSDVIYFSSNRSGTREIWKVPFDAATPVEGTNLGNVKSLFR